MVLCQTAKFVIYSVKFKKPVWYYLISTGGFPSSHSSLCVALCVSLGLFQYNDLGSLDWSFCVAVVFSMIVLHDAMGVRLEASKHAKILNNLTSEMTCQERIELGFGEKGSLKEMLGHRAIEVLGGFTLGVIIGVIGFLIFK
jgi:acid phosphatase family membrane protein YuiD